MSYQFSKFRSVASALVDQRMAMRHLVQLTRATVRRHAAQPVDGLLEDLSAYGCRVIVDGRYKAGDRLWVRLAENTPIAATAVWYKQGKLGCRFDDQLDRDILRELTLVQG